jgi:hypothetical protein
MPVYISYDIHSRTSNASRTLDAFRQAIMVRPFILGLAAFSARHVLLCLMHHRNAGLRRIVLMVTIAVLVKSTRIFESNSGRKLGELCDTKLF